MSALLAVVLDVDGVEQRAPAGIGATEAAAAVLRSALPDATVEVVTRAGRLAELLETPCDLVLLHDPGHPLAAETVLGVLEEWHNDGECVAAVGCAEVTDTLKHVDADGRVLATLGRDDYRTLTGPLVVTHAALAATVAVTAQAGDDVAAAVELLDRTVGVRRVVQGGVPTVSAPIG
jgi:2-C-methyl-D-erythritol 4-phosphate cytidylyltransferase